MRAIIILGLLGLLNVSCAKKEKAKDQPAQAAASSGCTSQELSGTCSNGALERVVVQTCNGAVTHKDCFCWVQLANSGNYAWSASSCN